MRALCLSGGGAFGAFEAGAILRLVDDGRSWDRIAGVSVGALNGGMLAQYAPADQRQGAKALHDLWTKNITGNKSVYKSWWLGRLMALWKGGLYNTAPLRKLIESQFDGARVRASGVSLFVGAVALGSGEYRSASEVLNSKNYVDWIMASAAMPVLFPPVAIEGDMWVDGGVRDMTPLSDVIADGVTEIDVVVTGPAGKPVAKADPKMFKSALAVAARAVTVLADEVFQTDLAARVPAGVKVRVISPKAHFTHDAFDFDPAAIKDLIAQGYAAAAPVS